VRRRAQATAGVGEREGPGRQRGGTGRTGAAGGPYPDTISLAEEGCCETERSRKGLDRACAAASQLAGRGGLRLLLWSGAGERPGHMRSAWQRVNRGSRC